jgi:hypothetical protein
MRRISGVPERFQIQGLTKVWQRWDNRSTSTMSTSRPRGGKGGQQGLLHYT